MLQPGYSPLTVFGRIVLVLFTVLIFSFLGAKLALDYQASLESEEAEEATQATPTTTETVTTSASPTATPVETGATLDNPFDVTEVEVGDTVAGMSIVSVGPWKQSSTMGLGVDNAEIRFEGEVTISGTYTYYGNDGILSDVVGFQPDASSLEKFPQASGDSRAVWFLFSNQSAARKVFGPATDEVTKGYDGEATLTIKNYAIILSGSEATNLAELVSVTSKD